MHNRIVIAGGPRVGKTTLACEMAAQLSMPVLHTDDLIGQLDWSAASQEVAGWFNSPAPWIIEGVACFRALRKWLEQHPEGKPCDLLIVLTEPHLTLTKGQTAMAKGCDTVWGEIRSSLFVRCVEVQLGLPRALLNETQKD